MFKPKPPKHDQGFTLTEVLVAILITTVFVATAMQAVVIAAIMRVRAKEFSEASAWIQENLENVKYQASQLDYDSGTGSYNADTARCTATTSDSGYGDKLRDAVTGSDQSGSNNVDVPKNSTTGKQFRLRRTTNPSSNSPHSVLQITYTVTPTTGGDSVANLYTEVIPDVAFKC